MNRYGSSFTRLSLSSSLVDHQYCHQEQNEHSSDQEKSISSFSTSLRKKQSSLLHLVTNNEVERADRWRIFQTVLNENREMITRSLDLLSFLFAFVHHFLFFRISKSGGESLQRSSDIYSLNLHVLSVHLSFVHLFQRMAINNHLWTNHCSATPITSIGEELHIFFSRQLTENDRSFFISTLRLRRLRLQD